MVTDTKVLSKQSSQVFDLVGKAIATQPVKVRALLDKHSIPIRQGNDAQALVDGVLFALERKGKEFQNDLSNLLQAEDHFLGAIAGAVGAVAGAVKGRQEAKAMKAQAKAQTMSAIFAYKAQQDQTRLEELKLRAQAQNQPKVNNTQEKKKDLLNNKTILIVAGVAVAIVIIILAVLKKQAQPAISIQQPQQVIKNQ
jgi:hypothetical protein